MRSRSPSAGTSASSTSVTSTSPTDTSSIRFRDRAGTLSRVELDWRRVALTREQVEADLPVIPKWEGRRRAHFDAVETEALDQTLLLPLIDRGLANLLPHSALDRVTRVERQARQLAKPPVRERLAQ
jgi:hypothetical protein